MQNDSAATEATEDPAYRHAQRYVRRLRKFYAHAASYVLACGLLTVLNYLASPGHWWVQWIWFGWGIGLAYEASCLFESRFLFGADWEQRKIREVMESRRDR